MLDSSLIESAQVQHDETPPASTNLTSSQEQSITLLLRRHHSKLSSDFKKCTLLGPQRDLPDGYHSWRPVSGKLSRFTDNQWLQVATLMSMAREEVSADEFFFKLG